MEEMDGKRDSPSQWVDLVSAIEDAQQRPPRGRVHLASGVGDLRAVETATARVPWLASAEAVGWAPRWPEMRSEAIEESIAPHCSCPTEPLVHFSSPTTKVEYDGQKRQGHVPFHHSHWIPCIANTVSSPIGAVNSTLLDETKKVKLIFCTVQLCNYFDPNFGMCYCCPDVSRKEYCHTTLKECRANCAVCNPKCMP